MSVSATLPPADAQILTTNAATTVRPLRICVLTEDLSGCPDEGIKKFALTIARALRSQHHDVSLRATRYDTRLPDARVVQAPRTFVGSELAADLSRQHPDIIIYVATASTSVWAFARSRVLKQYAPGAKVILVGLQDRRHPRWQQRVIRLLAPDLVGVQSEAHHRYLERLGCRAVRVPSGVDVNTFRPVSVERRHVLRAEYGLDANRPVVLHVGHLQRDRGVAVLGRLAARWPGQVVLVASSSTRQEPDLHDELRAAGVRVFAEYAPHVEHFYQLADAYLFPVRSSMNSISAPLSVLEALASGLPVATTRFGGLPNMFGAAGQPGLVFANDEDELIDAAIDLTRWRQPPTRPLVEPYSWEAVAAALVRAVP